MFFCSTCAFTYGSAIKGFVMASYAKKLDVSIIIRNDVMKPLLGLGFKTKKIRGLMFM